jgi:hypothetical protein
MNAAFRCTIHLRRLALYHIMKVYSFGSSSECYIGLIIPANVGNECARKKESGDVPMRAAL